MQKINEKLSIEIWKEIAYSVQKLNFSNGGEEEFNTNIGKLKKFLLNLNLCLLEGKRNPKSEEEMGLSSLLQSIYDTTAEFPKTNFYEQVYILKDLGIEEIEYCPILFYKEIRDLKKIYQDNKNRTVIDKAYTDGIFSLKSESVVGKNTSGYYYDISNLQNANFILNILLEKTDSKTVLQSASASLKNFNGRFPSKKEIMKDTFPEIIVPSQTISFGEEIQNLKEQFEFFHIEELSCIKKLKKNKQGWYFEK